MKKNAFIIIVLQFMGVSVFAQFFFIPIIVPSTTYVPFSCPPANNQALEYYQLGIEKIRSKELDVAIVYFQGSIKKDSLFCDAFEGLAYCYRIKNQSKNALDIINLALKVNASNFSTQKTKGYILLMDLKDYEQSAVYFRDQSIAQPENALWQIQNNYKKDAEFKCFYGLCLLKKTNPNNKLANRLIKKARRLGYPVDMEIARLSES